MFITNRDIDSQRQEIIKLKKEKNAVILTHIYQRLEVQDIADHVGDSLALSRFASKTNKDLIVFCGVHFMAETAKLLNPSRKVLLPDLQSGCPMADMITDTDLRAFKAQHPGVKVVCYVNSSASVKAESDVCCTSTNAVQIVKAFKEDEIIFVPDKGLGLWVQDQVKDKKLHIYDGFCPTHFQITPKEVFELKKKYDDAVIVAHPECTEEVWRLADFVGSTSQIYKFIANHNKKKFIILSEHGLVRRMQRDFKDKIIVTTFPLPLCPNMKYHRLESVLEALKYEKNEITIPKDIFEHAARTIHRMFELTESSFWEGPCKGLPWQAPTLVRS